MDFIEIAGMIATGIQPIWPEVVMAAEHTGWWARYQIDRARGAKNA